MLKLTKVFIAEDSPSIRAMLKTVLQRASDIEIIGEAEDGETTITKVNTLQPDIVLMDISLTGKINGLIATKRIKENLPNSKIIMVTANDNDQTIFDSFAAGADGYYLKSNSSDQLLQAVRSVSAGAAWLHPAIAGRVLRTCFNTKQQEFCHDTKADSKKKKSQTISKYTQIADLTDLACELMETANFSRAEHILEACLALAEKLGGERNPDLAKITTLLADLFYEQEKYIQAEEYYLKSLELRHSLLGYEHNDVASSLENLANLYDTRGNYDRAEQYYLWALKIREKTDGNFHPSVAATYERIAGLYRAQGKLDLASELEKKAKKIKLTLNS